MQSWSTPVCFQPVGLTISQRKPLTIHGGWDTTSKKITDDIALNVPRFENGELAPNDGPGLGIDLNEEFIQKNITKGLTPRIIE